MLGSTTAWSASLPIQDEYMIMDLARASKIQGVISQGRKDKPWEFVKNFTVQYSLDGSSWQEIPGIFRGGSWQRKEAREFFPKIVEGRYLKLVVKSWNEWISMRAAALVCKSRAIMPAPKRDACSSIQTNPSESARTYSSVFNNEAPGTGHAQSMLDSPQGWSAAVPAAGQYMVLDVGKVRSMSGVIMQGRKDKPWEFVKRFEAKYSSDGSAWHDVNQTFFFAEKPYRNMIRRWSFQEPVKARYLKLVVLSWNSWISMRAGLFLCAA